MKIIQESSPPQSVEQRLEEIRGKTPRRSPNVRVLAGYAQHTSCNLATLGFITGTDFDRLLRGTPDQMPFGQSPFAISRGLSFEKRLRDNNYAAILDLFRLLPGFPKSGARVVNLREGYARDKTGMP